MRAQDIVERLGYVIPQYVDAFSESLTIDSIAVAGTVATVTTSVAHNLIEGESVAILGVDAPVQIDTATFARVGTQATFETLQEHDLTLSERDKSAGGKTLTISGATEAEFNGTFQIIQVVNRRKLIIAVADSGPTTISGSPIVEDANGNIFNGWVTAYNITASTFDYDLPVAYSMSPVVAAASVQTMIRIVSTTDIDDYILNVYTKQSLGQDQLVVQLGDVIASKKRNEETDASDSSSGEVARNQTLVQGFAVYIIMNATGSLTATELRDTVEASYMPAIFKALARHQFASGFSVDQFQATFVSHGTYGYADPSKQGKALYIHEAVFEQLAQVHKGDMADPVDNVAMRDINITIGVNVGDSTMTADLSLDDEPI